MIHQLIFAHPRPGLTEDEFGRYWLHVHGPEFAARIPQIVQYKVDLRQPELDATADPLWCGVAEIWLRDETEQLASLQTPEFLQGARLDEPRWAAFWRTLVLDTDPHVLFESAPGAAEQEGVKVFTLVKRREGLPLDRFRERALGEHAALLPEVPGLRSYTQGHVRDAVYGVGEAPLDAAFQATFAGVDAAREALDSVAWKQVAADLEEFVEPRYVHRLVVGENWVIRPGRR